MTNPALKVVTIESSLDGSPQKSLFYVPPEGDSSPVPLLVALHTWGGDYLQCDTCPVSEKWVLIAPDFRGPNGRPEACASVFAIQDVLDAVQYAKEHANIDASRIYLIGFSGGGHMSLMMAAKAPEIWAGVSAWVPISDLSAWHASGFYTKKLEAICGGPPGSPETDKEYRARSPLHFLPAASGIPIDINAGIHDGHDSGTVPISQSLLAFNLLAEANGFSESQMASEDIHEMTSTQKIPLSLQDEFEIDPERKCEVLFRRVAGPARITIFEGGHEAEISAAWNWLGRQKKGAPAFFDVPDTLPTRTTLQDACRVAQ